MMYELRRRRRWLALVLVACATVPAAGQRGGSRAFASADADRAQQKLAAIYQYDAARTARDQRTPLTESEFNAYLAIVARVQIPAGVNDLGVFMLGNGRLMGRATVDLDAVRTARSRGWLDPMRLLGGQLPVSATGVLRTQEGMGQFELESAQISGVPVPQSLLQELVSFYTQSADHPSGVSLAAPFVLPAGIRAIEVGAGQAIIVQ